MKQSLRFIAQRLFLTASLCLTAFTGAQAQYWDIPFEEIEIEKVIDNGPQDKLLNIAVCAEGYTEDQLGVFKDDAINLIGDLLNEPPYRNYRNFINVYLVYTPSNASGIGQVQDTYFGATIRNERIVQLAYNFYFNLKKERFPWCQKGIVLLNTTQNGGVAWAGELMSFTKSLFRTAILRHEIGHTVGLCADEYAGYEGANFERHNLTQESDPEKVPWKNWLGETVTHNNGINFGIPVEVEPVYITNTYTPSGWYHPYHYCIMADLGNPDAPNNPYCPPCREAIIVNIHEWTNSILKQTPEAETEYGKAEDIAFTVDAIQPLNNWGKSSNAIKWYLDGKLLPEKSCKLTLPAAELAPGLNKVEAFVTDTTFMVRRDNKDELMTDTATWQVNATNAAAATAISIGETGYTTFYATIAYVMPANLKAYVVTIEDNRLKLVAAYPAGSIVPARTPLLIEGEAGNYPLQRSETVAADSSGNLLIGTATETRVTASEKEMIYRLTANTEGTHIGFYLEDPTGQTAVNPAGEAYLLLPSNILSYEGYTLGEISTGIGGITDNHRTAPAVRYTIDGKQQGNRPAAPTVIIENGKKKVVR